MQTIVVGELDPMKKDNLIKFAIALKAKVCFDEEYGMKFECPDKKSAKEIQKKFKELKCTKNLT